MVCCVFQATNFVNNPKLGINFIRCCKTFYLNLKHNQSLDWIAFSTCFTGYIFDFFKTLPLTKYLFNRIEEKSIR